MAIKRKTRMYEPWGYREENDYTSSKTVLDFKLEQMFASSNYNKDDKKIHFFNIEGEELKDSAIDTTDFAASVIESAEYDSTTKILTITFSNGDKVEINLAELIDEQEFGDGLQVKDSIVSLKIKGGDQYLAVDENGLNSDALKPVIADLKAKIAAEIERATAAEQALDEKIDQEIADRIADVDEEETRAKAAEDALDAKIDQEIEDRIADVDAEETRAKAAEDALDDKIDAEITRATQTEQAINSRVNTLNDELDAEESAREAEDNRLWLAIETESARAKSEETRLDAKIDQEIADRIADVDEEEARAKAAEDALDAKIDAEIERATSAETSLNEAIIAETQRAKDAEDALDEKIDNEEARALSAETALANAINEESERAISAETEINLSAFFMADYDASGKTINFYNKTLDLLSTIDATPFIKDGMIDEVYIDHETEELVIVWNTEAGKQETRISLKEIFNPEDYYTKDDVDAKLAEKAELVHTHVLSEITDVKIFESTGLIVTEDTDTLELSAGEF